jgi:hypothetical protein
MKQKNIKEVKNLNKRLKEVSRRYKLTIEDDVLIVLRDMSFP